MHIRRTRARSASLVTSLVAVAIAVAAFCRAGPGSRVDRGFRTGDQDSYEGTPVKIGFITDSKGSATDNGIAERTSPTLR